MFEPRPSPGKLEASPMMVDSEITGPDPPLSPPKWEPAAFLAAMILLLMVSAALVAAILSLPAAH
jgi:hypothetical protein